MCSSDRVTERPLPRPAHLAPAGEGSWLAQRAAGAVALALGVVAFAVVAAVHGARAELPPWWLSAPGVAATAVAAAVSIARRERGAYGLWVAGLGIAGASVVLGWFLTIAIVIAAAALVIALLHALM